MSVASSPFGSASEVDDAREGAAERCPLCGSPLAPAQDWCLRCGAGARTRVAATPRWQPPLLALLAVAAVCLAVLAVALVKLARDSGPAPRPVTTTLTTATSPGGVGTPGAATTPGTPGVSGAR